MALEARLKISQQSCDPPERENRLPACQATTAQPHSSLRWCGETVHATVTTVKVRFADESHSRDGDTPVTIGEENKKIVPRVEPK